MRKGKNRRAAACVVILFFLLPRLAEACSCGGALRPVCGQKLWADDLILASVLHIREQKNLQVGADNSVLYSGGRRYVAVSVLEDFGGGHAAGSQLEIETGMGGGDCGYPFTEGKRYLISLYEHDGRLSTGICGQTQTEAEAALLLGELRANRAGIRWPDLSGLLLKMEIAGGNGKRAYVPVSGLRVDLVSAGKVIDTTITQDDGVYEFPDIAPGSYKVVPNLPSTLLPAQTERPWTQFDLYGKGTGSALCRVSYTVTTAGRIEGHVLTPEGKPVQGTFVAFDRPVSEPNFYLALVSGLTGPDGSFNTGPLPNGNYWFYFRPVVREEPYTLGAWQALGTGSYAVTRDAPTSEVVLTAKP